MKTSDVLRKAGDVLRKRGWCQGRFGINGGPRCVVGAIIEAASLYGDWTPARRRVCDVLGSDNTPAIWNDDAGRTAAEVMHVLDAAYVLALQLEGEDLDEYEAL